MTGGLSSREQARGLLVRAGWSGAQHAEEGALLELTGIVRCLRQARDAITGLRRGDCCCDMGIGSPMIREHSRACVRAALAVKELVSTIGRLDPRPVSFSWEDQPPEVISANEDWLEAEGGREELRSLVAKLPPWGWYTLTDDGPPAGFRYRILSYDRAHGDGFSLTVTRYSVVTSEPMWRVFGIDPETLVPANTPEEARANLSAEEIVSYERTREDAMARLYSANESGRADE